MKQESAGMAPSEEIQRRVGKLLGQRPVRWRRARGGYSDAGRYVFSMRDGASYFLKVGTGEYSVGHLRNEWERVYSRAEADFLPRVIAWSDDENAPLLVLEDLSEAAWPPPWTAQRISEVVSTLRRVRAWEVPGLPEYTTNGICKNWWRDVREKSDAFLGLGLVSPRWLAEASPRLSMASSEVRFAGTEVLHGDVRSDNLCFLGERAVLVDWSGTSRGNGEIDWAVWLPSLEREGGPAPEEIGSPAVEVIAWLTGYLAWHSGLPDVPSAPFVRQLQLAQLRHALRWAARAMNLRPPDGFGAGVVAPEAGCGD